MGAAAAPRRVIVALGDSITAGYGLAPDEAWPALLQQKIDALGLDYEVRNAGLSGDTTAGGLRRLDWVLRQPVGVLILALGGNDGLRGVPPETIEQNLQSMIDQARAAWPDVRIVLAGMKAVPNMGRRYAEQFSELFARVAERNGVAFVPFLLDDVGGMRSLNQPDGIHPTAEGQEVVAENVWEVLEEVLEEG